MLRSSFVFVGYVLFGLINFGASNTFAAADDGISYDGIAHLVQTQKITTIDDLLPKLPEQFRRGYTLVYNSRSLQDASPLNPRALVYGTTGKTIVAFNGDPSEKGHNSLEVMEYDSTLDAFNLRTFRKRRKKTAMAPTLQPNFSPFAKSFEHETPEISSLPSYFLLNACSTEACAVGKITMS